MSPVLYLHPSLSRRIFLNKPCLGWRTCLLLQTRRAFVSTSRAPPFLQSPPPFIWKKGGRYFPNSHSFKGLITHTALVTATPFYSTSGLQMLSGCLLTLPADACSLNIYLHQYWKARLFYLSRAGRFWLIIQNSPYNLSTHKFRNNFPVSSYNSQKNPPILADKSACHLRRTVVCKLVSFPSDKQDFGEAVHPAPAHALATAVWAERLGVTSGPRQLRCNCHFPTSCPSWLLALKRKMVAPPSV